jgi:DNA-binding IscR family transcriptional regulator
MFKLSRKIEYGLMTIKFLLDQKEPLSTREISDQLQIPFDTTAKILQLLNQQKIVEAEKGLHGGYVLKE